MPRIAFSIIAIVALFSAPRAAAQDSGVLLGLALSDSASSYRTLWIAPEGGKVQLLAAGPDLIVPRRSGFWRVCLVHAEQSEDGELHQSDSLVAIPATSNRGPCNPTKQAAAAPPSNEESERCSVSSDAEIRFLGPDAASIEEHSESTCGAHYSGGTQVSLVSLDTRDPVKLSAFLQPVQRGRLMAASLKAGKAEYADFGEVDTMFDPDAESEVPQLRVLDQWAVERGEGSWRLVAHTYCSPYVACGDGTRRFSVPGFPVPARLVGHDLLSPSLAEIKAQIPGVRDAISSPRRDLLVAFTGDSMLIFTPREGRLGQPVLRRQMNATVVMAQWAVGRFVPVWTDQLRGLLTAP